MKLYNNDIYVPSFITPVIKTGLGTVKEAGSYAKSVGATKILVVTDRIIKETGLVDKVTSHFSNIAFDVIDDVVAEPPFENLELIASKIKGQGYDLFVGVGGGSALDITKVLSVMMTNDENVRDFVGIEKIKNKGIPFVLIPTTAGTGSEVTYNAIFTDVSDNVKKGIVSKYLLPDLAIVDANMTLTCPPSVTAASGLDALVHAVESYTAVRASELTDGIALQAIKLISRSLRTAVHYGGDIGAREDMAMGSLLAGISLANAGVGAVHALAYPLGGKFKVPHGVANSLLLPYVMKYNVVADLTKFSEVVKAMGENVDGLSLRGQALAAVDAMTKLAEDVGIPKTLQDVSVQHKDLKELAEEAAKQDRLLSNNPRKLSNAEIYQIYEDAYDGR